MSSRPSGVGTFLFTDVEGSTRRWEDNPDSMGDALERHDAILRAVIEGMAVTCSRREGTGSPSRSRERPRR